MARTNRRIAVAVLAAWMPYTTLNANPINHPEVRGRALFADRLMTSFP
jgi:hypothetical protein